MLALRTAARTQLRVVPTISARGYAETAGSKGENFKHREQAEENAYVRKQEAAKLAKIKEALAKNSDEKKKLEAEAKELEAKSY